MATHKHRTEAPGGHRGGHLAALSGRTGTGTWLQATVLALMDAGSNIDLMQEGDQ